MKTDYKTKKATCLHKFYFNILIITILSINTSLMLSLILIFFRAEIDFLLVFIVGTLLFIIVPLTDEIIKLQRRLKHLKSNGNKNISRGYFTNRHKQ